MSRGLAGLRAGLARPAVRRFTAHRLAVVAAVLLAIVLAIVFFGPLLTSLDPHHVDPSQYRQPPSSDHPLGTDSAGRDVLARLIYGGRTSLTIGISASLAAAVLGFGLGALAGMTGGVVDSVLSRIVDVIQSFPALIIIILLAALMGGSMTTLVVSMAALEWPIAYRVVRTTCLSLREQDTIRAARGFGARLPYLLRWHVLPEVVGPLVVVITVVAAVCVLLEAALSFLGLGLPADVPSWGNMLSDARSLTVLKNMPWLWIPPGAAIAGTVLMINFVGDGIREATDPRQSR
jgi:peptide/nickel transport system permease protein